MLKEDKILIGSVEDRLEECQYGYMVTNSHFLDLRQRTVINNNLKCERGVRFEFYGGYEDSERVVIIFLPDYVDSVSSFFAENKEENPLKVIRVSKAKGSKELSHKDYLGSILGLGIKRELIGDILVFNDGADIVVMAGIAEFLAANYIKAGRTPLEASVLPIDEIREHQQKTEIKKDTVASLRIDNIVSSAFKVSRAGATEAIRQGVIFVNNLEVSKNDKPLKEGDKITFRGKGKVILEEIGGTSKKDRTRVTYLVYI